MFLRSISTCTTKSLSSRLTRRLSRLYISPIPTTRQPPLTRPIIPHHLLRRQCRRRTKHGPPATTPRTTPANTHPNNPMVRFNQTDPLTSRRSHQQRLVRRNPLPTLDLRQLQIRLSPSSHTRDANPLSARLDLADHTTTKQHLRERRLSSTSARVTHHGTRLVQRTTSALPDRGRTALGRESVGGQSSDEFSTQPAYRHLRRIHQTPPCLLPAPFTGPSACVQEML